VEREDTAPRQGPSRDSDPAREAPRE
jgi:hypothetical protein